MLRWLSAFFYSAICLLALNFFALIVFVSGQWLLGKVSAQDLGAIVDVLLGSRKYAMSREEIEDYARLRQEEEERRKRLEEEKGKPEVREPAAAAAREAMERLRSQRDELEATIAKEKETLAGLRQEIEALKAQVKKEQEALEERKRQDLKVAQSENRAKLIKTLANMDPAAIAKYFQQILKEQPRTGKYEVVRLCREYLRPDAVAEVLAAMPPADMQQILPLLENKYADLSAAEIAKRWRDPAQGDFKTPAEMAELLKQMPFSQAFRVYLALDADARRQLAQILQQD
ncbi:MAG: hypothetical protein N3A66_03265 [Planctomycetota bacterium]|nr:hypothetical protein [Planctomycetota bacterium]